MNKVFWKRNASTFIACIGCVGVVATAIATAKSTPKAIQLIEEEKQRKKEKLTKLETVKAAAPAYTPAMLLGAVTISCIMGSNVLSRRQQASLIGAYTLLNQSYSKYKNKVKELYGEEAHEKVVGSIAVEKAKERYIEAPASFTNSKLYLDGFGGEKRLFYIEAENRYFESTLEQVIAAEYHLNRNFTMRGNTILNEFYDFLGIEKTDAGKELGWMISDELYWIDFNHQKVMIDDDLECCVIEMLFEPSTEWQNYY